MRLVLLAALAASSVAQAATCEELKSFAIDKTTITSATMEGSICRVLATATPVTNSEIHIEIWLPAASGWNGKFVGTGNGGYSSALSVAVMKSVVERGYATAGSDTGHQGGDLKFAVGRPESIDDWAWRATHVMATTAKEVIRAYYGRAAEHSYFTGCSTGGGQALTEAQRFPDDFDGIIAGAPGNNRTRLNIGFLWNWRALQDEPGANLSAAKLPNVYQKVIDTCDGIDGLKDGLIDDPRRCQCDPGLMQCDDQENDRCLTASQVRAVRKIYGGARNPRTGDRIFAGWAPGSEAPATGPLSGWSGYFVGQAQPARLDFWRYWIFQNAAWDPRTFDFDRDVEYALKVLPAVNSVKPDLNAFRRKGGKLIMFHGWADPVAPPGDGIAYYERVASVMGGVRKTGEFFRLFMAPGMAHCGGGPGPNSFDALGELDRWVTLGIAPDRIVASHAAGVKVDRTRPLCPYPQVARWKGSGSIDEAASFACVAPPK